MPLLLTVDDCREVLTVDQAIDVIEQAYTALGNGEAVNAPTGGRMDVSVSLPDGGPGLLFPGTSYVFGSLQGAIRPMGVFAIRFKSDMTYTLVEGGYRTHEKYCVEPGRYCGVVLLFSIWNGELLAIIQDSFLQRVRVGATAGVGAKLLARADAETVGMIGSGGMARTYLQAFRHVRPIRRVRVFSPHQENREAYAREMRAQLELEIEAVDSAEAATSGADIVAMCTDASQPVIDAGWIAPGMHLSPVTGSELPSGALPSIDVLVRHLDGGNLAFKIGGDQRELDSGDPTRNAEAPTLADVLTGKAAGRTAPEQVTCFYNVPGSGIQFAAVGLKVYELARARGIGRELPLDWFLEHERD
jgi:alanine dehydrogenase